MEWDAIYYKECDQNVKQTFAWISLVCSSHDIAVDWWWWKGTALKAVFNQKADSEMAFSTLLWNMCANTFFRSQKHIWNMCANMLFESEKNILVTENIKGLGFVSHFWKYVVSFETTLSKRGWGTVFDNMSATNQNWKSKTSSNTLSVHTRQRGLYNEPLAKHQKNCESSLHKLPGKSSLNVRFVCPVWSVYPDHHDDHEDYDDHITMTSMTTMMILTMTTMTTMMSKAAMMT